MKKAHLAVRLLEKNDEDVNEAINLITNMFIESDRMFSFLVSSVLVLDDLRKRNYIGDDGETIMENLHVAKYYAEVDKFLAEIQKGLDQEDSDVDVQETEKRLNKIKRSMMN